MSPAGGRGEQDAGRAEAGDGVGTVPTEVADGPLGDHSPTAPEGQNGRLSSAVPDDDSATSDPAASPPDPVTDAPFADPVDTGTGEPDGANDAPDPETTEPADTDDQVLGRNPDTTEPTDTTANPDTTEPTGPADTTEPADTDDPDTTEPTGLADTTEPTDATEPAGADDPGETADVAEPAWPAVPDGWTDGRPDHHGEPDGSGSGGLADEVPTAGTAGHLPPYAGREVITVVERIPEPGAGPLAGDPARGESAYGYRPGPAPVAPDRQPGTPRPRPDRRGPRPGNPEPRPEDELTWALKALRDTIAGTAYPLSLATAEEAQRVGAALISQLDDYLLPRLARLDAPLLVVIGGSTGAGKSTLVNSIVRAPVSAAGVLRPTTRAPVLVCHPNDLTWFRHGHLLPGLTRTTEASTDSRTLQLVAAPALRPGLAFLDAPDIDSVVDENRALAAQLLAAADLWLFVTSAARYADAVPWELLRTARLRGTVTALVLDRVPAEGAAEIADHLRQMLAVHDLDAAPLFVLPETMVTGQGLLTEELIAPLRGWFERLAADAAARSAVVRQTLDGALAALEPAVEGLAGAADEQSTAAKTLAERIGTAHGKALGTVEQGVRDGTLLRGEVLARWQEFVGTGELMRALEARIGRVRDRVSAALTGRPAPGRQLQSAIESNLVMLIRGAAADAAEQTYSSWQAHPAGAALLRPELARVPDDLAEKAERLVREWQRGVLELVREESGDRRFVARGAAYAVNAGGLAVMIAVFASTAFIPTGLEIAAAGGTTVAAQKVLEAIFGDQAIRALAGKAREDLLARVDALLEEQATRYLGLLDEKVVVGDPGAVLRSAAQAVEHARYSAALTTGSALHLPGGAA